MAFGKDPNGAEGVVPFGGGTITQQDRYRKQAAQAARSSKSTGSAPYWADTFKLPSDHSRLGRFIPGAYAQKYTIDDENVLEQTLEYYMVREHYNGKRGGICSAGPLFRNKKMAQPCLGCDIFWEDVRERSEKKKRGDQSRGPNRMSLRNLYVFNWWDYGLWLKVPRTDGAGQVMVSRNTNQPFFDWVPAASQDPRANQYESKWGNLVAWPMSESYKDTLFKYMDMTIRHDCAMCGSQQTIVCYAKVCGNPACKTPIYDPNNCSLTMNERESLESEPYLCPTCNTRHFIDELVTCRVCNQYSAKPRRATLFDVDLELISVPSGEGKQTNLQILNRSTPRPIQVADPRILETIKPIDLIKKFSPTPLSKQSELWNIPIVDKNATKQASGAPSGQQGGLPSMVPGGMPATGQPSFPGIQQPGGMPSAQPQYQQPVQPQYQQPQYQPQQQPQPQYQQPTFPGTQPSFPGVTPMAFPGTPPKFPGQQ